MSSVDRAFATIMGALVLLLVVLFIALGISMDAAAKAREVWIAGCVAEGGHVLTDIDTATGVGFAAGTGQMVVTVSTTTTLFCLDENGGILRVL